jgi:hypothetical protein
MPALVGQLASLKPRRVVVAKHEQAERALASQQGPRLGLHRRRLDQARLSRPGTGVGSTSTIVSGGTGAGSGTPSAQRPPSSGSVWAPQRCGFGG